MCRSIGYATTDLWWYSFLCQNLHISISSLVFYDKCLDIFLATNQVSKIRFRHIDSNYYFVREIIHGHTLKVEFDASIHQLVYLFTKALVADRFQELRKKIKICEYHYLDVIKTGTG